MAYKSRLAGEEADLLCDAVLALQTREECYRFFDDLLTARGTETDVRIACPERVAPFAKQVEQAMADILTRNGLTPTAVSVRRMERPIALTEAFPKIFEGKNSVNVKA